ncbi:hypothetical protein Ae706Ps2_6336 [Pseudonocardia sp. Ae706_Ps2]|nr:hypothetical protein Ae706Ps2_6336 [Pseudonocardia sp. Ae706_Ps2]
MVAVVAVAGLLASGCSSAPAQGDPSSGEGVAAAGPARQAFDPPADFGAPTAVMSSRSDSAIPMVQVLDELSGWTVGSAGLVRVDFTTSTVRQGVFPDNAFDDWVHFGSVLGDPVVADTPAGRLALAAFPVKTPGQGTTPGTEALELVAADTATAARAFSTTVALPPPSTTAYDPKFERVAVIGVRGSTVVVEAKTDQTAIIAGGDLTTHQTLWTAPELTGALIVGDTVVASSDDLFNTTLQGLSLTDGSRRWSRAGGDTASPLGPRMVTINPGGYKTEVIAAATGTPVTTTPLGQDRGKWQCFYDQRSITVCESQSFSGKPEVLVGLDESGAERWRIAAQPGGPRVPPELTAVWHGAVYGFTDAGPVVLDAATGADRTPTATAAPHLVNEYFGIASAPPLPGTPRSYDYDSASEYVAVPATS